MIYRSGPLDAPLRAGGVGLEKGRRREARDRPSSPLCNLPRATAARPPAVWVSAAWPSAARSAAWIWTDRPH